MAASPDDHAAFAATDSFAVKGEAAGKQSAVRLEPGGECMGVDCRIEQLEKVVEGFVARHIEQSAFFVAHSQANAFALALATLSNPALFPGLDGIVTSHLGSEVAEQLVTEACTLRRGEPLLDLARRRGQPIFHED